MRRHFEAEHCVSTAIPFRMVNVCPTSETTGWLDRQSPVWCRRPESNLKISVPGSVVEDEVNRIIM